MQKHNTVTIKQKLNKYAKYLNLTDKQKKKKIQNAEQKQSDRAKNPQGNHTFPEKNFIKFVVETQKNQIIQLATFRYPSVDQPIALLFMFHGLNSHIGHGAHIAHQFSLHRIVTVGFDHRGFGQSQGKPGYVHSLESHLQDCIQFASLVKNLYKNIPCFCMGLSMGGMSTYYLTLRYPQFFNGAIMMAPALKNNFGGFVVGLAGALKKILPEKTKLTKPVYGMASKNPEITDFVKNDPYAYKQRASLSTAHMLISTMDKSPLTFKSYNMPFMIIQGGNDKLVNPSVAFELFEQSQTPVEDKEILFYENMWHDIWHEQQIYEIMQKVIEWIHSQVEKQSKQQKYTHEHKLKH